jgi:hypothetical protein
MRLKFDKNENFVFKKIKQKDEEGKIRAFWNNECNFDWARMGDFLKFHGTRKDGGKFLWETKEVVTSFACNSIGVKIETEKEIYYFDRIKK